MRASIQHQLPITWEKNKKYVENRIKEELDQNKEWTFRPKIIHSCMKCISNL